MQRWTVKSEPGAQVIVEVPFVALSAADADLLADAIRAAARNVRRIPPAPVEIGSLGVAS